MRTLHPFAPPLPSPTSPLSLETLMPHQQQHQTDIHKNLQQNDNPPQSQHQNLSILPSQNGSRSPPSSNGPPLADPSQLGSHPQSPNTQMSIQSLLAASRQSPAKETQQQQQQQQQGQSQQQSPTWPAVKAMLNGEQPVNGQPSSSKHRLDESDSEESRSKIRRTSSHPMYDERLMNMTTVVCLHAAVAQKSYGSEKRFLCPPPLVRFEGSYGQIRDQQLSMSIVSENGDKAPEQKAPLDANMTASFKFLHVTGTAKAKSFNLCLEISQAGTSAADGAEARPPRMWAAFESAPVTIISKPSKKTAKTRNISSCILAGGPVSLFNRINSQTVRTKYMTIDHAHLCASNVSWSAFNVNVLRRPSDVAPTPGPQPVTYGSEIVLSDSMTGIATAPLVIRKVDKGKISMDDGGPVSQMQKIALQRVNQDGTRHYLSAAGPHPGTPGLVAPPAPGVASQAGTHQLLFQSPRVREEVNGNVRYMVDEVDDYLCWTIVGISKFQYTFFDALGNNSKIPEMPITPFPTLFTPPVYRPANNVVEMTVSNFFYENPKTGHPSALEVWLGDIGPLQQRVYQAPLNSSPITNVQYQPTSADGTSTGTEISPSTTASGTITGAGRYPAPGPLHSLVVVEMPPVADVVKVLEDEVRRLEGGSGGGAEEGNASRSGNGSPTTREVSPTAIAGRNLPLLFIRGADGVGYHSGRTVSCENIFQGIDLNSPVVGANGASPNAPESQWVAAAAQAAASPEGSLHGWTLRII